MKVACLLLFFFACCLAENDIYLGGNFLLTLEQNDGNLNHISSLVSYDPNEDEFIDTFDGGVFKASGQINLIQETPLGTFASGIFRFIDDEFDYSNSVVRYNNDDDDFETLKDGIYLRNGESVRHICGTDDYTYFSGVFTSVEYLSEKSQEDVFVPNIVRINSDDEWSLLNNDKAVFPGIPDIDGLACTEDTVYLYAKGEDESGSLYSYANDEYTLLTTTALMGEIVVDTNGNIGGISADLNQDGNGSFSFVFFDASNSFTATSSQLFTFGAAQCSGSSLDPLVLAYLDGFLITMPDVSQSCYENSWAFYSSSTGLNLNYNLPTVDDVDLVEAGEDGDLWLASHSKSSVYYLPNGGSQWIETDLSYYGTFTVYAMAWDNGPEKLLVYGYSSTMGMKLLEVKPIGVPPVVKEKNPGSLYIPGTVAGLAVMDDPDDDDYELFIAGTFDGIGKGHNIPNFVRYKQGSYDSPLPNMPPIGAIASNGSTIFYATVGCAANNRGLPIGYYSKNTELLDVWTTIPLVTGGTGCVTALYADSRYVFVGGSFTVSIPGSGDVANAVVYFDRMTNDWHSINIPSTISSSSFAYDINTLSVSVINNVYYLAIGGHFEFSVAGTTYYSFAMCDLSSLSWYPVPAEFAVDSVINSVLIDDISSVYIAGSLKLTSGGSTEGVFVFDVSTNTYRQVGYLPTVADSIILHTDDSDDQVVTTIYAGGNFVNGTKHLGLAYTNVQSSASQSWSRAADDSQFFQYYTGDITEMVYATGGVGANNTNGYQSSYTAANESSGGGMSGWGIFFLTAFILLVVLGVIAGAVGGFVYMKKRQNYQEL